MPRAEWCRSGRRGGRVDIYGAATAAPHAGSAKPANLVEYEVALRSRQFFPLVLFEHPSLRSPTLQESCELSQSRIRKRGWPARCR